MPNQNVDEDEKMGLKLILLGNDNNLNNRLHEQTGIPWLDVERMERCSVEAFKAVHNMSSTNVNNMFPVADFRRSTRASSVINFRPPVTRTKFGDNNLPNRCDVYWRAIPGPVKSLDKLLTFKSALKKGEFFVHQ